MHVCLLIKEDNIIFNLVSEQVYCSENNHATEIKIARVNKLKKLKSIISYQDANSYNVSLNIEQTSTSIIPKTTNCMNTSPG